MNYFSKYVTKFQDGGAMQAPSEEEQLALNVAQAVIDNGEAIVEQNPDMEELVSGCMQIYQQSGDIAAVAAELIKDPNVFETVASAVANVMQAQEVSMQRFGGKIAYLDYLKCGGKAKNAKKMSDGGENNIQRRYTSRNGRKTVEYSKMYDVPPTPEDLGGRSSRGYDKTITRRRKDGSVKSVTTKTYTQGLAPYKTERKNFPEKHVVTNKHVSK